MMNEAATLSASDVDRLETVEWGELHFGSLTTNRQVPRRDMLRLVERGLVRSVGTVTLCDDDGATLVPERHAEGYALTDAGRRALADARRARDECRGGPDCRCFCDGCGEHLERCDCED